MWHYPYQLVHRWCIVYKCYLLLQRLKLKPFVALIGKMLMVLIHYQHSYIWSDGRSFSKKLEICRILLIWSTHSPLWAECHGYIFKHSDVCQKNCLCICNFIAFLTHPSQYFSYMTLYISSPKLLVAFIVIQGGIFLFFSLFSVWPPTLFSTYYSNTLLKVKLFSSSQFLWYFCYSEWMLQKYKFLRFNLLQPFFSLKINHSCTKVPSGSGYAVFITWDLTSSFINL